MEEQGSYICQKCQDTGIVREKSGQVHVCFDCLQSGKLDVHSKKVPDSKVKI